MATKRRLWLWIPLGTVGSLIFVIVLIFLIGGIVVLVGQCTKTYKKELGGQPAEAAEEEEPTVSTEKKLKIGEGLIYESKKIILKEYEIVKMPS